MPSINKFLYNIITIIIAVLFLCVQGLWAYPPERTSSLRPMSSAKLPAKQIEAAVARSQKFPSTTFIKTRQKLDAYIGKAMNEGRSQLYEHEFYEIFYEILKILGINVPEYKVITDPENIPTLPDAEKLVLKIISTSLHKSEETTADGKVEGVVEDVSPEDAPQIIRTIFEIKGSKGVLVCSSIRKARGPSELLIGFTDADLGRLICFGEGGWEADFRSSDRAYRSYQSYLPFSAEELIASTEIGKSFIYGKYGKYRRKGLPLKAEDLENLINMLVVFKRYYDDEGRYNISGLDINPLICHPDGRLFVCDAKLEFQLKKTAVASKPVDRIRKLFHPKSIAVIGAVANPHSINPHIGDTMDNIIDTYREHGKIYFYLNPPYAKPGRETGRVREYRNIPFVSEIPDDCDLYVVLKPPGKGGIEAVKDGLSKGAAVIMIPAGFDEVEGGADLAKDLNDIIESADKGGCVVGPNTMGIITPDFNTTFANMSSGLVASKESNIALIAQSGGVLPSMASSLALRNTKIHYGVSIGNTMDLKAADYLEYILEYEPQIKAVAMYLESAGGERLSYLINEASKKGVFVIINKGGTTEEGAKAALSHTAAGAGLFKHFKAVLEQAGAIVFPNTADDDLWPDTVYAASYFAKKGIPRGKRVAGLNLLGSDTVTMTDVVEVSGGLEFPQPDERLREFIQGLNLKNDVKIPFDMTAAAGLEHIKALLKYLDPSEQFDFILFAYFRWLTGPGDDLRLIQFARERSKSAKPLIFVSKDDSDAGRRLKDIMRKGGLLVFDTSRRAILALDAILKSGTAATKSLSADQDNLTASDLPLAEFKASCFNHKKDAMVIKAVSTAA